MITTRRANACGHADFGWLQARYSFSFGHYFDPQLMGYASLRVLNQEVLAAGSGLQPRAFPSVDVLNIVLQGTAEYRDSDGYALAAEEGEALLFAAQAGVSYSELNLDKQRPLTRLQLWLAACPERENTPWQKLSLSASQKQQLIASPDGEGASLQLRQQMWISQISLAAGEELDLTLRGNRGYLQSVYGALSLHTSPNVTHRLGCGDGAFLQDEGLILLRAEKAMRVLVIDSAA